MIARIILENALQHLIDRGKSYDSKEGERSISKVVTCFNVVTGLNLTEEEGYMFMAILKLVRSQQGGFKADSYEDGAAYFALMAEESAKKRK